MTSRRNFSSRPWDAELLAGLHAIMFPQRPLRPVMLSAWNKGRKSTDEPEHCFQMASQDKLAQRLRRSKRHNG